MKALIVKKPWIDFILDGQKIWEIRGRKTNLREEIALIQSGSGKIVGTCEIVDCKEVLLNEYKNSIDKHKIRNVDELPYKKTYAWIIKNVKRYEKPIPYTHPKGAIIWVNINEN